MFKILSFTSHTHPRLKNKTFALSNAEENTSKNYYSIIIGPNGTGKSYLISEIIECFNEISLLLREKDYKIRKKFTIEYLLNNHKYLFSSENKFNVILKDGNAVLDLNELRLPKAWLASSVSLSDKYPLLNYIREQQIPQYKYLGIRSASNNAFISRIKINTVLYLIRALERDKINSLLHLYKSLGLNPSFQIELAAGSMLKLEKEGTVFKLYDKSEIRKLLIPHLNFIDRNKEKKSYRADNYKHHLYASNNLDQLFNFLYTNKEKFEKNTKGNIRFKYNINLSTSEGVQDLLKDWPAISIMLDLELIKFDKFIITKKTAFKFEEASSGESHLLTSLHGIVAYLEDDSLLVIDEPEISLHPNWQLEYFDILKSALQPYTGVNVIISSHSHLLMSNLLDEESKICSVRPVPLSDELTVEELDYNTYGWDPESILYNVFEVATLRNKYFEIDLKKLISLISTQSHEKKTIKALRDKIAKFIMTDDEDPLQLLIDEVDNYLQN